MTTTPIEFDPVYIASRSTLDAQMYCDEVNPQEPMKPVPANNPEIYLVPPKRSSEWGQWEFLQYSEYSNALD